MHPGGGDFRKDSPHIPEGFRVSASSQPHFLRESAERDEEEMLPVATPANAQNRPPTTWSDHRGKGALLRKGRNIKRQQDRRLGMNNPSMAIQPWTVTN